MSFPAPVSAEWAIAPIRKSELTHLQNINKLPDQINNSEPTHRKINNIAWTAPAQINNSEPTHRKNTNKLPYPSQSRASPTR